MLFICICSALSIAVLETSLRLFAFLLQRKQFGLRGAARPLRTISDSRLGHRPNPGYPGHDRNGFRNSRVPDEAFIVTLGDSQTYGNGVSLEENWPSRLKSMIHETVYNMAFGGYGPAHSLILWDEAVALNPKFVLVEFYAGNDLFDSFDLAYNQGQLEDLKTSNSGQREIIKGLEASNPISVEVNRTFRFGRRAGLIEPADSGFISKYSKIYSLFMHARYELSRRLRQRNRPEDEWELAMRIVEAHPKYFEVFIKGKFKTVFTSQYRLTALNLDDPRIAEGLHISLEAFRRMSKLATSRSIRFMVVLIPSKEAVFRSLLSHPTTDYRNLQKNEERLWRITKHFLNQNGIPYLDALPALQETFERGNQPYNASTDGHLNKFGHQAIAELVAPNVKSQSKSQ